MKLGRGETHPGGAAEPRRNQLRALCRALLAACMLVVSPRAWAIDLPSALGQDSELSSAPLSVEVRPILGSAAPASPGWTTYLVTIDNRTASEQRGKLYLAPTRGLFREADVSDAFSQTPLQLAGSERVTVELPAFGYGGASVDALVLDAAGQRLGLGRANAATANVPHLLAIDRESRIPQLVHGAKLPQPADPMGTSSLPGGLLPPSVPIDVASSKPHWDSDSNLPLLPRYPAGYAPATLVVCPSRVFVDLPRDQQHALTAWVFAGGTFALLVSRDTDLQHPALARMLGGNAKPAAAGAALRDPIPTRVNSGRSPATTAVHHVTRELSASLVPLLRGYTAPNLHETRWGASATYGLGEVTLLGFDPERPEFSKDPWTKLKLLDLLGHAWDRRLLIATPHGATAPDDHRTYSVRRFLLGTRHQHWAIAAAAFLLIAYAVVAGPVNFHRARRQGRPLVAFPRLLLLSTVCMVLVLLVGTVSRGTGRRARHLTLLDAGAGLGLASATRFRAFYGSSLNELVIEPLSERAVFAIVNEDQNVRGNLHVTGEGYRLSGVVTKPWQTLHVREDGFADIGSGVSLVADGEQLSITNRLGRDLTGVLVRDTNDSTFFFERISDGQQVKATDGAALSQAAIRSPSGTTGLLAHEHEELVDGANPGAAQAWTSFEWLRQGDVDWWPQAVPVLLGQVSGGEGLLVDSGFAVESDRVMLRVTGFGGRP